jgi:hypothetical protein
MFCILNNKIKEEKKKLSFFFQLTHRYVISIKKHLFSILNFLDFFFQKLSFANFEKFIIDAFFGEYIIYCLFY